MERRFIDQNITITEFQHEAWVKCPSCGKRAIAIADYTLKKSRLSCPNCSYHKELATQIESFGTMGNLIMAANQYFGAELWLQHPFKNDIFFAYNDKHLYYLENYISAKLREHKDRSHFTLLERLPKFYHEGKNRQALLKIIERLKTRF